jgi:hypothetical protein
MVRVDGAANRARSAKPISQSGAKLAVGDFLPAGETALPSRVRTR